MGNDINVNKINEYLIDNGLSKTEFCKKSKLSMSTFNKIINDKGNFRLTALVKISKTMKIRICELFKS